MINHIGKSSDNNIYVFIYGFRAKIKKKNINLFEVCIFSKICPKKHVKKPHGNTVSGKLNWETLKYFVKLHFAQLYQLFKVLMKLYS